jgi:excisionase family DNA binding protein
VEQLATDEMGWWKIRRAAEYLDVSEAFLRKAVRLRKVPFVRVGSKALRFRKADLDLWVQENTSGGRRR